MDWSIFRYLQIFKSFWNKICARIWNKFWGRPNSANTTFVSFYEVFCQHVLHLLHNQEFTVLIYNAQQIFISNHKNICANHFPWFVQELMMCYFSSGCIFRYFRQVGNGFTAFFHVSIHVYSIYGFVHKQAHLLNSHVVFVQLVQNIHLQFRRYYYSFAFYSHTICHGQLMSDRPIFLYVLCPAICFVCTTLYDICLELFQVCICGCCFIYIRWMDALEGPLLHW